MNDESKKPAPENAQRIAKYLARVGVASRRDVEKMIAAGRVQVNGQILETPAVKVTEDDVIKVDGTIIGTKEKTRLWLFNKPRSYVTTHKDEKNRETIFDILPKDLPRVVSVGRLDINSEGLLLLTNDGELSRYLELPATGLARTYRVRAYGKMTKDKIAKLDKGIKVDGVQYGPIHVTIDKEQGANVWLNMILHEGKNREIRHVLSYLGLEVSRLIRISYGPFQLGKLPEGAVKEVSGKQLKEVYKI